MIDQNSDRMWFVIGILIVGAAIFALAINQGPALYATMADTFGGVQEEQTINPNLLNANNIRISSGAKSDLTSKSSLGRIELEGNNGTSGSNYGGIELNQGLIKLKPNTDYVLHYRYQKLDGKLLSFGGHSGTTIVKSSEVFVDDKKTSNSYSELDSAYAGDNENRHRVEVKFRTSGSITSNDYLWIQPNRGNSENVRVAITDLKLEKGKNATRFEK